MTTKALEQVARAMCLACEDNPDLLSGNWPRADKGVLMWEEYLPEAKAAIQSLIDMEWPDNYECDLKHIDIVDFETSSVSASECTYEAKAMLKQILDGDSVGVE